MVEELEELQSNMCTNGDVYIDITAMDAIDDNFSIEELYASWLKRRLLEIHENPNQNGRHQTSKEHHETENWGKGSLSILQVGYNGRSGARNESNNETNASSRLK
ncbi:hypothetical protein ACH5RR_032187 [Cinchona calisaya]|uniref:Uncharacterized protein n=1 Tax=Cinchona calisaya TaxID=153742 RepID=A0ABD2YKU3_9GENT